MINVETTQVLFKYWTGWCGEENTFPQEKGGRIAAPLVKYWRRRPTLYTTRQLNPFRRPCAWWPNINSAELLTSGLFDASHFKHPSEESQLITIIER